MNPTPPRLRRTRKILVIVGPTASGKSDLAVKLAKKIGGEIISADSRQVYKGLNIGTGKVTKKEMRGVPHHLLDVASPREQFSAADFVMLTNKTIVRIVNNGRLPIIVGGTGFYIDALAGKISLPNVGPNKELRNRLRNKSIQELFSILKKRDPKRARTIDRHNRVRLVRALEIVDALGSVPTSPPPSPSRKEREFIWIGLKPDSLDKRIGARVRKMFKQGLLGEIRRLKKSGVSDKRLRELGFEYWQPTRESVIRESKRYVKRQMTWFKRNKDIKWFKSSESKQIEKYVHKKL